MCQCHRCHISAPLNTTHRNYPSIFFPLYFLLSLLLFLSVSIHLCFLPSLFSSLYVSFPFCFLLSLLPSFCFLLCMFLPSLLHCLSVLFIPHLRSEKVKPKLLRTNETGQGIPPLRTNHRERLKTQPHVGRSNSRWWGHSLIECRICFHELWAVTGYCMQFFSTERQLLNLIFSSMGGGCECSKRNTVVICCNAEDFVLVLNW